MAKPTSPFTVIMLFALALVITVCEIRVVVLKRRHQAELIAQRAGLELSVELVAERLAESQARAGHATYLALGLPTAEESRHGFPVLNLGCGTDDVLEAFAKAYDDKLETLADSDAETMTK